MKTGGAWRSDGCRAWIFESQVTGFAAAQKGEQMVDPIIRTAKIEERTAESAQNVPNDELISKKAAIELFLADGMITAAIYVARMPSVQPAYTDEQIQKIIQKMQEMEPAQLDKAFELGREDAKAEIVRCKDCRYRNNKGGSTAWLPCMEIFTPSNFYCGHAERRTNE